MAWLAKHFAFVHVPRTGGTWVCEALRRALPYPPQEVGTPHGLVETSLPVIACVRHPADWLRSYWSWELRADFWLPPEIDAICYHPQRLPFTEFAALVVERWPGIVMRSLAKFYEAATVLCRTENLLGDLAAALAHSGESFDAAALLGTERVNASRLTCEITPEVRRMIEKSEPLFCERFGYGC